MDQYTQGTFDEQAKEQNPCASKFKLCQLKEGQPDRLGHSVEEIFWNEGRYAVYRSERGVYVQFSDSEEEATAQRSEFTEISPELCELRYLTHEMRSSWPLGRRSQTDRHPSSLYEHNMAEAVMLILEKKNEQGVDLAKQALKMAVDRVTGNNTAKYFGCCVFCWIVLIAIGITFLMRQQLEEAQAFIIAALFGATGAMLSVATRLGAFELYPCQRSGMNYLMASSRIGIGFISGPILLLLGLTVLKQPLSGLLHDANIWQETAVLGLIGGFTERLVPNLLRQTSGEIESRSGTPVLAARSERKPQDPTAENSGSITSNR